jgi:FkbM family methyltransferase
MILRKFATFTKILPGLIKENTNKKKKFSEWFAARKDVINWLYLYGIYSSFLIDVAQIAFSRSEWAKGLTFKGRYVNADFAHPLMRARNSEMMAYDSPYMRDYVQYHDADIPVQADDTIIDIGAHLGKFSIPFFLVHPTVRVYAYEPDPSNYCCILKSLNYNSIDIDRFKVEQLGVYSRSDTVEFIVGGHSSIGTIGEADMRLRSRVLDTAEITNVAVIPLDQIFKDHSIEQCKILKMDCEGAEYEILYGATDDILKRIEYLLVEIHPTSGHEPQELISYLRGKGYDLRGASRYDGCWEMFGKRERKGV